MVTDLGLVDGHQLVVADATTPKSISIILKLEHEVEMQTEEGES